MTAPFDPHRIRQLLSAYYPDSPPMLPLDFGDYLSILWRQDRAAINQQEKRMRYYRQCGLALAEALGFANRELGRLARTAAPGELYAVLENVPYRSGERAIDAADRRAAIRQLLALRHETLTIGVYSEAWIGAWPGSGILDSELRDRVFSVLFTALPGQYTAFARLLFVTDIVLQELLIGTRENITAPIFKLIREYGYPDPRLAETRAMYEG